MTNLSKQQLIEYAQYGMAIAWMLVFSRVFLEEHAVLEFVNNLCWAQSLGFYAMARNRNIAWGLLGFFFGILGFISLFFLEDRSVVTE